MIRKDKIVKWGLIVALILPIIFLAYKELKLKSNTRFTIGVTTGAEGGGWIGYSYSVNNIEYNGSQRALKYRPTKAGGKYFVEFDTSDPSSAHILWDKELIFETEVPSNGWGRIADAE